MPSFNFSLPSRPNPQPNRIGRNTPDGGTPNRSPDGSPNRSPDGSPNRSADGSPNRSADGSPNRSGDGADGSPNRSGDGADGTPNRGADGDGVDGGSSKAGIMTKLGLAAGAGALVAYVLTRDVDKVAEDSDTTTDELVQAICDDYPEDYQCEIVCADNEVDCELIVYDSDGNIHQRHPFKSDEGRAMSGANNVASSKKKKESETNWGMIIGLTAGAIALLVIMAIMAFVFFRMSR